MYQKGRCDNRKGEKGHHHKLTRKNVYEIRQFLTDEKLTQQQIADKYEMCNTTVCMIKTGKNWKEGDKNA